jgi:hypothetical protein
MDFIKNFALKFLPNVDNNHPIQKKIISNGDCFFHSLEYAKGEIGLYDRYSSHINDTRTNIVNAIIRSVGSKYKVEGERVITDYRNTSVKLWAENIIIREAALMAQKNLFIVSYNQNIGENNGRVMLIQPKGLKLNTHNILFIINKGNTHFVTFKSDSVGHKQQLTELIQSSPEFITKLNRIIFNRRVCVNLSEIDDEVKESRVKVYSFLLRDFDNALFNSEVNKFRPHNYNDVLRLQQKYNNTKTARDLRNLHLSDAIDARLKQINNNAIMARELQKGSPKTLKERKAINIKSKNMSIEELTRFLALKNSHKTRKTLMKSNEAFARALALENSHKPREILMKSNEAFARALALENSHKPRENNSNAELARLMRIEYE